MKVNFITRDDAQSWGGDMRVVYDLMEGMRDLGVEVEKISSNFKPDKNQNYILSNTCQDQREPFAILSEAKVGYHVLPFHEDFIKYYSASFGFPQVVYCALNQKPYFGVDVTLDDVFSNPELANYFPMNPLMVGFMNAKVLSDASQVYPSSEFERMTVARDASAAKCTTILFPTDQSLKFKGAEKDAFSKRYGIPEGYVLQVGRLESRKNQIGTVVAAKDLDVPLVFVCTRSGQDYYERLLIDVILKVRKAPTYIISQTMRDFDHGVLKVRNMGDGKKLPWDMLESAYRGALVNCHPAFYELPGLTYLESMSLGVKTICSKDTSIREYICNPEDAEGLYFVAPADMTALRECLEKAVVGPRNTTAKLIEKTERQYAEEFIDNMKANQC